MNQVLAGSAVLVTALVLLTFNKRSRNQLLKSNYEGFGKDVNHGLISFVQTKKLTGKQPVAFSTSQQNWEPPRNIQQRVLLEKQLNKLMKEGPEERLKATSIAAQWGHKSILPLLKKGLRDFDSRVVIVAAQALQSQGFFFHSSPNQPERLPRNVSLMR